MSNLKLIALLLVSFVATGSVIYQIRSRRPKPPVTSAAARSTAILPPEPTSVTGQTADAPATGTAVVTPVGTHTDIPEDGWGRNPFLTIEEINALNHPPAPEIVQAPVEEPRSVEPAAPPTYAVTAIIYGPNGSFAVVNSRVVQAGDRVGMETVKEIRSRGIVLEYDGHTRELPLRRIGPEIQLVPKGD